MPTHIQKRSMSRSHSEPNLLSLIGEESPPLNSSASPQVSRSAENTSRPLLGESELPAPAIVAQQTNKGSILSSSAMPARFAQGFSFFAHSAQSSPSIKPLDISVIPKLPVLEATNEVLQNAATNQRPNLSNKIFACGQHLLATTASLLLQLIREGVDPKNIYVVGKSYSNSSEVIAWLRDRLKVNHIPTSGQEALGEFSAAYEEDISTMWGEIYDQLKRDESEGQPQKDIIVVDDGGVVLSKIKHKIKADFSKLVIVGIEQTTNGKLATKRFNSPVIDLWASYLKNKIEPAMVAEKIAIEAGKALEQIPGLFQHTLEEEKNPDIKTDITAFCKKIKTGENICYGVIGLGSVGTAVLEHLIKLGKKQFIVYDANPEKRAEIAKFEKQHPTIKIKFPDKQPTFINSSDVIFGCTGTNIITDECMDMFKHSRRPKVLISCSSKDVEFQPILNCHHEEQRGKPFNPLDPVVHKNSWDYPVLILRGGMPVNFNNELESVPSKDIQIIRGILLQAVYQACEMIDVMKNCASFPVKNYMLEPIRQLFVYKVWANIKPDEPYYPTQDYVKPYANITEKIVTEGSKGELFNSPAFKIAPYKAHISKIEAEALKTNAEENRSSSVIRFN